MDSDNPEDSADDGGADTASDMELDKGSEDWETQEVRNVKAVRNVPGLIWPIRQLKKKIGKALTMVSILEMRTNTGI